MTAASSVTHLDINNPCEEVVTWSATDLDEYTSKKFGKVRAVQATLMEDTTTLSIPLSCGISGAVVTINCTGLSGKEICLTLYGDK